MMRITGAIGVVLALALTGCGGGSSAPPEAQPTTSTTTSASPSPTYTPPSTAKAMIHALKNAEPAVDGVIVYSAATDTNHLLGRPNGYKSKGAWRDSRIPASETPGFTLGDIDVG